jgi:hypothetical protein
MADEPTLDDMRAPSRPQTHRANIPTGTEVAPEARMPTVTVGFGDLKSFELTQRVARAFAFSSVVPEAYRAMVPMKGDKTQMVENPNGLPNCMVAIGIAHNLGEDPITVMQNMDVIEGRPAWRATFVTGRINRSGQFGRLRYRFEDRGKKSVEYETTEWVDRKPIVRKIAVPIHDVACWAIGTAQDGTEIVGPEVSVAMAVQEGWYTRRGSKWKTMSDLMLRYRAAAFFSRTNAPELTMGMQTVEELGDIIDVAQGLDDVWTDTETSVVEDVKVPQTEVHMKDHDGQTVGKIVNVGPTASVSTLLPWYDQDLGFSIHARKALAKMTAFTSVDDALAVPSEKWDEIPAAEKTINNIREVLDGIRATRGLKAPAEAAAAERPADIEEEVKAAEASIADDGAFGDVE